MRVKQLKTDAEILAWYNKLKLYDASQISAKDMALPESQWFTYESDTDSGVDTRGKVIERKTERYFSSREVSLLNKDAGARRLDLPQLDGGDPRPFEVVGISIGAPGYHVIEIESARLGQSLLDKRAPMYVRTGVLVTYLGVHFKLGRENSVVWVTSLDRGKPAEGAEFAVNDCTGKKLWSGKTDANGLAKVAQAIDADFDNCPNEHGLFVTARKVDNRADAQGVVDTAFVFSGRQKGIESWRFNLPTGRGAEPDVRAATVFDRTLLRADETVSMKHFVRFETLSGLANAKPDDLPTWMKIIHQGRDRNSCSR